MGYDGPRVSWYVDLLPLLSPSLRRVLWAVKRLGSLEVKELAFVLTFIGLRYFWGCCVEWRRVGHEQLRKNGLRILLAQAALE